MKKLTIAIFIVFLTTFMILNIISPSSSFSEIENRSLQTFPKLSIQTILNGQFSKAFETYSSDQFIFRNQWIEAKTRTEKALLKVDHHGVYFGKDDYLIERFTTYNEAQATRNITRLTTFMNRAHDYKTYSMLIPGAASILKDQLPRTHFDLDQNTIIQSIQSNIPLSIDVSTALQHTQQSYYSTDHHWNIHGAYIGYQTMAKTLGFEPLKEDQFKLEVVGTHFQGTLFSKSGMFWHQGENLERMYHPSHDSITMTIHNDVYSSIYFDEFLKQKDQYMYFMGGNHPIVEIDTHHEGETLLIVKDSFANILVPFLIPHYSRIIVVDVRFVNLTVSMIAEQFDVDQLLVVYSLDQFLNEFHLALLQ